MPAAKAMLCWSVALWLELDNRLVLRFADCGNPHWSGLGAAGWRCKGD